MDIKDILLILNAGSPCETQAAFAARLAKANDAELSAVCLFSEPNLPFADSYAIGRAAVSEVLVDWDRLVREAITPSETAFRRAASDNGVRAGWNIAGPDEPVVLTAERARVVDLVVLRRPEASDLAGRDLAATIAMTGGAPCLIVPDSASPGERFGRIGVAWNGSREAKHALDAGLDFLKAATAVEVLIVDGETTSNVDEPASEALLQHLARHGVPAELRRIEKGRHGAGDAILRGCDAFGADLLVMGAYGHSRAAEAVLGGATRTMLSRSAIPILMSH